MSIHRFKLAVVVISLFMFAAVFYSVSVNTAHAADDIKPINLSRRAYSEYLSNRNVRGGEKYVLNNYGVVGEDWCVDFVTYIAQEAGLAKGGYYPRAEIRKQGDWSTCNVAALRNWFLNNKKGVNYKNDGTYIPTAGDLVMRGGAHVGIVYRVNSDKKTFKVIEGNTNSNDARSSVVAIKTYTLGNTTNWTDFIRIKYAIGNNVLLDLSKATISDIPIQKSTGYYLSPSITITVGDRTLDKADYRYTYENNRGMKGGGIYAEGRVKIYQVNDMGMVLSGKRPIIRKYKIKRKPIYSYSLKGSGSKDLSRKSQIYSTILIKNSNYIPGTTFYTPEIRTEKAKAVHKYYDPVTKHIHYTSDIGVAVLLRGRGYRDYGIQFYEDPARISYVIHLYTTPYYDRTKGRLWCVVTNMQETTQVAPKSFMKKYTSSSDSNMDKLVSRYYVAWYPLGKA